MPVSVIVAAPSSDARATDKSPEATLVSADVYGSHVESVCVLRIGLEVSTPFTKNTANPHPDPVAVLKSQYIV